LQYLNITTASLYINLKLLQIVYQINKIMPNIKQFDMTSFL